MKLTDFQIVSSDPAANGALFAIYEPIRLWLRERSIDAPFRKIVVELVDQELMAKEHGTVMVAIGICDVREAVSVSDIIERSSDQRWVFGLVEHALSCIKARTGWHLDELNTFVSAAADRPPPLVHFFERLARVDRRSGVRCIPWLSARAGETQIGVRVGEREVTILSAPGSIFLEDDFPMAKSAIREEKFLLLDKAGKTLAEVPIHKHLLH